MFNKIIDLDITNRHIAILRLVRYGNMPLPKAGAYFHVLQAHENRYKYKQT